MFLDIFQDNFTALHIAVEHCKPLAVQTLLGFGAKVELKGGKVNSIILYHVFMCGKLSQYVFV